MIETVISGGQIGVDIAALRAAAYCGIETGGWAPAGYRTKLGPNPELMVYGLDVTESTEYPPRTRANVRYADATLIIAAKMTSPGEKCTLKAVRQYGKSGFAAALVREHPFLEWRVITPHSVVLDWLNAIKPTILNVAGTGDSSVESAVEKYLIELFKAYNGSGNANNAT